ncbi:hypothetical protein PSCICN_50730 [Pseudomonas cichorii]|nr:hypothetical protein PSCICN_50730 [Pseudomonas cichorii]
MISPDEGKPAIEPQTLVIVIAIHNTCQLLRGSSADRLNRKALNKGRNQLLSLFSATNADQATGTQFQSREMEQVLQQRAIRINDTTSKSRNTSHINYTPFDEAIPTVEFKYHHATSG